MQRWIPVGAGVGASAIALSLVAREAHGGDSHPFDQRVDRAFIEQLPPEPWGAPVASSFGAGLTPAGFGVTWKGRPLASPGEPVPALPLGTIAAARVTNVPGRARQWTPGGSAVDLQLGVRDDAVHIGAPTVRGAARGRLEVADHALQAAADAQRDRAVGLSSFRTAKGDASGGVIALGSADGGTTDLSILSDFADRRLGIEVVGLVRRFEAADGTRTHRVGLGTQFSGPAGLAGGIDVDHHAVDQTSTQRMSAWLGESQQVGRLSIDGGARLDTQDRTGSRLRSRIDLSPRLQARIGVGGAQRTGIGVRLSRSAPELDPRGTEGPAVDHGVLFGDGLIGGEQGVQASAGVGLARFDARPCWLWSVEIERPATDRFGVLVRSAGGEWIDGARDPAWAESTAAITRSLGDRVGVGLAGRWRSRADAPPPPGAIGWLSSTTSPRTEVGGRIAHRTPVGRAAVEVALSGWARARTIHPEPDRPDSAPRDKAGSRAPCA